MAWNWQHKNWPRFDYDASAFAEAERQFMHNAGLMHGSLRHIADNDKDILRIQIMSEEAFKTSEIEGERLNRDSLQSSIRRHFGIKTDNRKIPQAEQGISEMLIAIYKTYDRPLDHEMLHRWYSLLTNGRNDLTNIGKYRTHSEPMQIVSGSVYDPKVHYEAPPSNRTPAEMDAFISWFNGNEHNLTPLLRASIAHLWFESIHPYEDGNGRIGRALSEKALSQSLGRPTLISLAHMIEKSKKEYYAALHEASLSLDIQSWLDYFTDAILKAQDHTQSMIDFLIAKGKFYDRFSDKLNGRQAKVIERMFREGLDGFKGGLSAENYITIANTSRATATRDLQNLVQIAALRKEGELRYTRYYLDIGQ